MGMRTAKHLLGRRGLMAGAAALVGAGIARLSGARPVEAGHDTNIAYDSQTAMHVDVTNTTAGSTRISSNISGTAAFVGLNNYPVGISRPDGILGRTAYTTSGCAGVAGSCEAASGGIGVLGTSLATNGVGVFGYAGSNVPFVSMPAGSGVFGSGPSYGVIGQSSNGSGTGVNGTADAGPGVFGYSNTNAGVFGQSASGIAIYATSGASYGVYARGGSNQASVYGDSSGTSGTGVYGIAGNNAGVFGRADTNFGVYGQTMNGSGVVGHSTGAGFAGQFFGNVNIVGNLTVTGSFPKSAGVPHPDGSVRRMYCMEGPESAFEDWGRASLKGGQATVKLESEFAPLVTTDEYSVFLTPEGDCRGLFVARKTAEGFDVRELGGGTSDVTFSYRILARRKDLVGKSNRLERIQLPRGVRRAGERGVSTADADFPTAPRPPKITLPNPPEPGQRPDGPPAENERRSTR